MFDSKMLRSFLPEKLPEQAAAMVQMLADMQATLHRIERNVTPVTPDVEPSPLHFDIPSSGFATSQELFVTSLLISPSAKCDVTITIGQYQFAPIHFETPNPLQLRWTGTEALEVTRGLSIILTPSAGTLAVHCWAFVR